VYTTTYITVTSVHVLMFQDMMAAVEC
jgi:hypothetical protein